MYHNLRTLYSHKKKYQFGIEIIEDDVILISSYLNLNTIMGGIDKLQKFENAVFLIKNLIAQIRDSETLYHDAELREVYDIP